MNIAIFPGSFNPFTIGHADIVRRALPLFDRIVIAVGYNAQKAAAPPPQRTAAIERIYADEPRVKVVAYSDLTVDLAAREGAHFLLRGVRSVKDFEYERDLAAVNAAISLPSAAPSPAAPSPTAPSPTAPSPAAASPAAPSPTAPSPAAASPTAASPAAPVVSGNWLPESRPLETILLIAQPQYAHISSSLVRELASYGRDITPYLP